MYRSVYLLLMVAFGLFQSGKLHAAEVRRISKKAVTVSRVIPDDGLTKGATACFFNADEQIGCGVVVRVGKGGKTVFVKAKRSVKRKLKKGFLVRGEGGFLAGGSGKLPLKIWGLYGYPLTTPATFNKIAYQAHADEAPTTLWDEGDPVKGSKIGFGFAVGIPIGKMLIIPGMRYRLFTSTKVFSDLFVDSSPNRFVEVEQSASAIALYTDLAFLTMDIGSMLDLFVTTGLDIDMSTVNLKATQKDDSATPLPDEEFASAKSTLTLLGLRLGAGVDFMFAKAFGVNLGLNIVVPLAKIAGSLSGKVEDTTAPELIDQDKDLEAALGHKKSAVGIELALGILLAF